FILIRPRVSAVVPYPTLFRSQRGGRPRRRTPPRLRKGLGDRAQEAPRLQGDRLHPGASRSRLPAGRGAPEGGPGGFGGAADADEDRKSTRLNSSHGSISYAVF